MPVGPFDRRRQRFRCLQCSSSHLKCDGLFPCENCTRRQTKCNPQQHASPSIAIEAEPAVAVSATLSNGQTSRAIKSTHSRSSTSPSSCTLYSRPSLDKETYYITGFFTTFLPRNNFTGRSAPFAMDIASQIASYESLYQSATAIGALQTSHMDRGSARSNHVSQALSSYKAAISSLSLEISSPRPQNWVSISWSIFLLGLFELLYDDSGQGWLRHFLFGTSKLLQSLSPQRCRGGSGMRLFLEIRPFEIARAMLFSEPTFLATAPWTELTQNMWTGELVHEWSPKESLLDIMTSCTDLSLRTRILLSRLEQNLDSEKVKINMPALLSLAEEGAELRSSLIAWAVTAPEWTPPTPDDQQMIVAWTFYAAISIYLSGIYDYARIWVDNEIPTPTLNARTVSKHTTNILDLTSCAIEQKIIAGLLFLFPLRIAGARAHTVEQRIRIRCLLLKIAESFRAANAFLADLEDLWADPESFCNKQWKDSQFLDHSTGSGVALWD